MKIFKKSVAMLIAVITLLSAFTLMPITSSAKSVNINSTSSSGSCGKSTYWSFKNGVLNISGKGAVNKSIPSSVETATKKMYVYDGVTDISGIHLANCSKLTNITIGKGLKKITANTFYNCNKLSKITISGSNKYFASRGNAIFTKSMKIMIKYAPNQKATTYTAPKSVTTVDKACFMNSKKLKTIKLPSTVKSIGDEAYMGCTSLTNVTMARNLTYLGTDTLRNTKIYNTKSNWKNGVLYYKNALIKSTSNSDSITVKNIKYIASNAFYNCRELENVKLPNSLVYIGDRAFFNCTHFHEVVIPKSVKKIGKMAFAYYEYISYGADGEYDDESVSIKSIPFSFYVYKNSYGHKYAYNNGYHYIFK